MQPIEDTGTILVARLLLHFRIPITVYVTSVLLQGRHELIRYIAVVLSLKRRRPGLLRPTRTPPKVTVNSNTGDPRNPEKLIALTERMFPKTAICKRTATVGQNRPRHLLAFVKDSQ